MKYWNEPGPLQHARFWLGWVGLGLFIWSCSIAVNDNSLWCIVPFVASCIVYYAIYEMWSEDVSNS